MGNLEVMVEHSTSRVIAVISWWNTSSGFFLQLQLSHTSWLVGETELWVEVYFYRVSPPVGVMEGGASAWACVVFGARDSAFPLQC